MEDVDYRIRHMVSPLHHSCSHSPTGRGGSLRSYPVRVRISVRARVPAIVGHGQGLAGHKARPRTMGIVLTYHQHGVVTSTLINGLRRMECEPFECHLPFYRRKSWVATRRWIDMMLISCIVNYVSLKREKLLRLTNGFQTRL